MKDFYGKKIWKIEKKNFRKNFHEFFGFRFVRKYFYDFFFFSARGGGERSEQRGGVGERSEPPAGGLAVGAEGSVNSDLTKL